MLSRSQNMSKIVSSDTLCKGTNYLQMHSIALILPMCIRSKDKLQKSADHEKRSDIIKLVTFFVSDFSLSHMMINEKLFIDKIPL